MSVWIAGLISLPSRLFVHFHMIPCFIEMDHSALPWGWGALFPSIHIHTFEVPVVSDNWLCWSLFLDELRSFFLKPSQTTCDVWAVWQFFFQGQFSSCGPWRIFSHSKSPPHCALARYRHTSSCRQFRSILCWLEILNYCPDGGNGDFHCSSSFLKAT